MPTNPKTYPASWTGQLILACRKCQKKLKRDPHMRALAKLKKTVKRHNKEHSDQQLHVINVPCMDLCPKDGVTVCCPALSATHLSILRGKEDIQGLCRSLSYRIGPSAPPLPARTPPTGNREL